MRNVIKNVKFNHPLKNITRRDANFHGWEFQKSVSNRKISVTFKDADFNNNPALSLKAALIYRDGFNEHPTKKMYNHMGVTTIQDLKRIFA